MSLLHVAVAVTAILMSTHGAAAQMVTPTPDQTGPYGGVGVMATSFHAECCGRVPDELRHGTRVTVDVGMALNPRADVGARIMLMPAGHDEERMHSRAVLAGAKYRFWPARRQPRLGKLQGAGRRDARRLGMAPASPSLAASLRLTVCRHAGRPADAEPDVSIDNLILNHRSLGVSVVLR